MQRRTVLKVATLLPMLPLAKDSIGWEDTWGRSSGYPYGISGGLNRSTKTRVGNYSGGYEKIFPFNTINKSENTPTEFDYSPKEITYPWLTGERTIEDYLNDWPVTSLLICRQNKILYEKYRFDRTPEMRMTSWSMAKSITSLLLGICLSEKLIDDYDDLAEKYVPSLKGTLHGGCSLRNLSNMSSGAQVVHGSKDYDYLYPNAFMNLSSDLEFVVSHWNNRREDQGVRYNYNELCPLTIGMVIRQATGVSLATFTEKMLWKPMGTEDDATWLTDSKGKEFNCIGVGARTRDWARVGNLIANRGVANNRVIISENWINEFTHWTDKDRQCRHGTAGSWFGYKAHMWHAAADGSMPFFNGHHGQRVIAHMPSQTVIIQTALDHEGDWQRELFAILKASRGVS